MPTLVLTGLCSALASSLTFLTGFGLGTILLPVFVVVMGPALAVAAVAPVHLFHNFGKLFLLRSHVDRRVLVQFGGPALVAAAVGAWGLGRLTDLPELAAWSSSGTLFRSARSSWSSGSLLPFSRAGKCGVGETAFVRCRFGREV